MVRDLFQLNTLYKRIIVGLFVLLVSSIALYGVLGVQTYSRVVTQSAMEQYIADVSASVSALERDYMERMDALTLDEAHTRGFVDTEVAFFVSKTDAPTLTLHDRAY